MSTQTYLITRCHGLMTHLLTPDVINTLTLAKDFQEIVDILTPTDYGKDIREQEQIDAFMLERIFNKRLMDRNEFLSETATDSIGDFLSAYCRKFEIQNILRVLRDKILKTSDQPSKYTLLPIQSLSSIDIDAIAEAEDLEEAISSLKNTPYTKVTKSMEWYNKFNSLLPIESRLKKIYYDMLFDTLKNIPMNERKKISQLIRAEVDIANCFTSTAASVYGYDEELMEFLLIPYSLKLSLQSLRNVIRTESPHDILSYLSPYYEVAKYLLAKEESMAHTEALRILRDEVLRLRISSSMNLAYVVCYLYLCEFECRDLSFIALATQHNLKPESHIIYKR